MSNRRFSTSGNGRNTYQRNGRNNDKQRSQIRNIPNLLNKSFLVNESIEKIRKAPTAQQTMLHRTSSPYSINFCEHCEHDHMQECCLYIYDDISDIARYASFKKELDEPYWINSQSEDFDMTVGNVTPKHFPWFTDNDPDRADRAMLSNYRPQPVIYLRQYVWPVLLPPVHQLPVQDINRYTNPYNMKFTPPPCYGDFFKQQHPQPYMPCIMRQVAIPIDADSHHMTYRNSNEPQIIESHSYMPIHYY